MFRNFCERIYFENHIKAMNAYNIKENEVMNLLKEHGFKIEPFIKYQNNTIEFVAYL